MDEAVAPPASQMRAVERQVRKVFAARAVAEFGAGLVERAVAVSVPADCGGHFAFGGAQPPAHLAGEGGVGLVVDGANVVQAFGGLAEVPEASRDSGAERGRWPVGHSAYIPGTTTPEGHLAAYRCM